MTSDVVLTAALRNNLLSLQNTQRSIDITQFRLATGRKVNSALDNPQSFFAAQSLNNRASDLTRLLDSIGQSIQVIKAADNGVTALTTLVEQASSIAESAREALAQGQTEAKIVGNVDLRGIDDLTADVAGLAGGATLTFTLSDPDDSQTPQVAAASVVIGAAETIESFLTDINNIRADDTTDFSGPVFEATLNDEGGLEIRALNGGNMSISFTGGVSDIGVAQSLGYTDQVFDNADAAVELTAAAGGVLTSLTLYDNSLPTPEIAHRTSDFQDLIDGDNNPLFAAATTLTLEINGQTLAIDLSGTIQGMIDDINSTTGTLSEYIRADFDEETGQITIKSLSADVTGLNFDLLAGTANFGWTADTLDGAGANSAEYVNFGASAADLARLEDDYNRVRDQIDALVQDTGYRGTNLLNGDDLLTVFNEHRTSTLTSNGVTFTSDGLGISEANFNTTNTVDDALDQVRAALESVRNFGTTLANDLAVIQTRQTFTEELINTLKAGSDALTVADQNEEGAKLLALQTRQQLGVTSLALASQSQQSILRLF